MRKVREGTSEPSRARLRYRNQREEELYLGLTGSILRDADGRAVGYVIIFQDVTDVVAMEIQLRRSERLAAVGEMSAKIAHEIRNPLAAISGSVQILRKQTPEGPEGSESCRLMDIVVREADRLSGLIQDFLLYARPRQSVPKAVELTELVKDVLELFESALPDDVTLELEAQRVVAYVDRGQIEQVLWNLLLNAVQAMPEGGELRVSVSRTDPAQGAERARRNECEGSVGDEFRGRGWAEICVADTGVGITSEVQELMFEPFFTTKKEGSGLGLSTVHRIIEGHGGQLQVAGNEGRGTSFWVRLPLPERPK
jgi:two-component system sensor histidine kinase PilS (NtrC family)